MWSIRKNLEINRGKADSFTTSPLIFMGFSLLVFTGIFGLVFTAFLMFIFSFY